MTEQTSMTGQPAGTPPPSAMTTAPGRGMKRTGKNAFWLVLERGIHLVVAFVVSFVVAGQLGAADYGQIAVGLAVLNLMLPIASIISSCTLRDVAAEPQARKAHYTASVVTAGLVTSVLVVLTIAVVILTVGVDSPVGIVTIVMVGASLLKPLNTVDVWFLEQLQSKRTVKIRITVLVLTGALRVSLPLAGFGVVAVAWTYVLEAFLSSLGMWIAFRRAAKDFTWEFNWERAKHLLGEFTPLFIATSSAMLFMKLNQVQLAWLGGLDEAGVFSLGTSLAETPRFPIVALMASLAPRLLALKNRDPERYWAKLQEVSRLITLIGYGLTAGLILVVAPIAPLLLPDDFDGISMVIIIVACTTPFICMGGILLWIQNWEKLYREAMIRNAIAAVISIGLGFILMPAFGAIGASITTLVTAIWVYVIGAATAKRTRPVFWMTLPSLEPISSTRVLLASRRESKRERREMQDLAAEMSMDDDPRPS